MQKSSKFRNGSFKALFELFQVIFQKRKFAYITVRDLKKMLSKNGSLLIIDCRSNAEYEDYHIAGAINIPYDTFMKSWHGVREAQEIVTICYVGMYSRAAAQAIAKNRKAKVYSVLGGMDEWFKQLKSPVSD